METFLLTAFFIDLVAYSKELRIQDVIIVKYLGSNNKGLTVTLVRSRAIDPAIFKLSETLDKHGFNVKVLLWDRDGRSTHKNSRYSCAYFRLKAPYSSLLAIFFLPMWMLYEFIFLFFDNSDIIHASDLDTLIPALMVKSLKKVKLFYTIYDFYSDNLPNSAPQFLRRLISFVEKIGISKTDAVFLVDHIRFARISNVRINRVSFIYNSPPDFIGRAKASRDSSDFLIFYAGVIHRSRGLTNIIKAIRNIEGVRLKIAGTGPDVAAIKNLPNSLRSKVKYIGFVSYEEVIANSLAADLLFAFYDPRIPANIQASPNKLFEAMMCSKPIIVNKETNAAKIVNQVKCGLVVPYGDVESIMKAILFIKNNPSMGEVMGKNGRVAYEKRFSWQLMEKNLLRIYDSVILESH